MRSGHDRRHAGRTLVMNSEAIGYPGQRDRRDFHSANGSNVAAVTPTC